MENYDNIELTGDEIQEALRKARQEKYRQIREAAYWAKVKGPKVYQKTTAEELFQMVKLHPDLEIDEENKTVIGQLALYFSCDERMKDHGLDPKKGIMIVGPPGCGKTTLLKLYANNMAQSFQVISCRKIGYEFADRGFETVENYSRVIKSAENIFGHSQYGICFDDLGADEKRKRFGDEVNVMADVLLERYDKVPFKFTHITSNLTVDQLEDIYGARLRSRLREMCNFIEFDPKSKDRRK